MAILGDKDCTYQLLFLPDWRFEIVAFSPSNGPEKECELCQKRGMSRRSRKATSRKYKVRRSVRCIQWSWIAAYVSFEWLRKRSPDLKFSCIRMMTLQRSSTAAPAINQVIHVNRYRHKILDRSRAGECEKEKLLHRKC